MICKTYLNILTLIKVNITVRLQNHRVCVDTNFVRGRELQLSLKLSQDNRHVISSEKTLDTYPQIFYSICSQSIQGEELNKHIRSFCFNSKDCTDILYIHEYIYVCQPKKINILCLTQSLQASNYKVITGK